MFAKTPQSDGTQPDVIAADEQAAIDRANEALRKQREAAEAEKACLGDDAIL